MDSTNIPTHPISIQYLMFWQLYLKFINSAMNISSHCLLPQRLIINAFQFHKMVRSNLLYFS